MHKIGHLSNNRTFRVLSAAALLVVTGVQFSPAMAGNPVKLVPGQKTQSATNPDPAAPKPVPCADRTETTR